MTQCQWLIVTVKHFLIVFRDSSHYKNRKKVLCLKNVTFSIGRKDKGNKYKGQGGKPVPHPHNLLPFLESTLCDFLPVSGMFMNRQTQDINGALHCEVYHWALMELTAMSFNEDNLTLRVSPSTFFFFLLFFLDGILLCSPV